MTSLDRKEGNSGGGGGGIGDWQRKTIKKWQMRDPQKMVRMRKKDGADGSAGMCHGEHKIADAHKLIMQL